MELAARLRRRRSLIRHSTNIDTTTTTSWTQRRTRSSAAKMDVDSVKTTDKTLLLEQHQQHQQQQESAVDANVRSEDITETELAISAEVEQTGICAAEQSHGDSDDGTVEATTSDSAVDEDGERRNDNDHDYFVDVSPVDDDAENSSPADGASDDGEAVKPAWKSSEDSAAEMSSDASIRGTGVAEDDLQVEAECDQLPVMSDSGTDVDRKPSGTVERTAADAKTDTDNVETIDITLHHISLYHHHQRQQQQQQSGENASETAAESEEEKHGTQENDRVEINDDCNNESNTARGRDEEEEEGLQAVTSPGTQRQQEAVQDLLELQTESTESNDRDHPVKDLAKVGVPYWESGVGISTPVKTELSCDVDGAAVSPSLQSNRARPLPPPPAALFYPGEGPPVRVIRVTCGDRRAEFHVDRLAEGLGPVTNSIGTSRTSLCVRTVDNDADDDDDDGDNGLWMTPNQFQRASGRGTARDWKRSIKHHGVSLKSLLAKAVLSFDASCPGCRCNMCTSSKSTPAQVDCMSALNVVDGSRKRSSAGDAAARCHRKQAKSDVVRQLDTSPASPESRDSSSDDADADVTDRVSLPSKAKELTMSSIVEELRTSRRQLADKLDATRRHGSTSAVVVADNNNNNDDDYYNNAVLSSPGSAGGLWDRGWRPTVTPTSSAAERRTGQSRSRRRRSHAELCYDDCGALDLTSTKKAARTSNSAPRRPPAALMNALTVDSVPLDLSVRSRLPATATSVGEDCSADVQTASSTLCAAANLERVCSWTVRDVANFISLIPGCRSYAEGFSRLCVDGATLSTLSVHWMSSELDMRTDAAEAVRLAVDRILAPPLL